MMSFLSRSPVAMNSRRSVLFLCLAGLAFLFGFLVVKDLNEKLGVMTSSNAGYQKMTDRQLDSIKKLQDRLRDEQRQREENAALCNKREKELVDKKEREVETMDKRAGVAEGELGKVKRNYETMSRKLDVVASEQAEANHRLSRAEAESIKGQAEAHRLSQQVTQCVEERGRLQKQYLAMFKQQQQSEDTIQYLSGEKERLSLELHDIESNQGLAREGKHLQQQQQQLQQTASSKNPVQHPQIQPMHVAVDRNRIARSSTPRSAAIRQQVNMIAEPFHPESGGVNGSGIRSSTKAAITAAKAAPVAAEPPRHQHVQQIPAHQVNREDVMEAPGMNPNDVNSIFSDYLHQINNPSGLGGHQQSAVKQLPNLQHPLDRPQQPNVYTRNRGGAKQQIYNVQPVQEEPVYARRPQHSGQQQQHKRRQQQHHFVRPDSVRFQRREVDSGNKEVVNDLMADPQKDDELTGGEGGEDDEEEEEEEDGEEDEMEERGHGQIPMYGQAPLVLRHIDHGRNEDANDLEFDHQQSHFSAGGSGVGGSAVGNDDVVNPAEFGIHHVNMERNQLRRFQGSDVGGFSYHQIPVPNQPGSRVF